MAYPPFLTCHLPLVYDRVGVPFAGTARHLQQPTQRPRVDAAFGEIIGDTLLVLREELFDLEGVKHVWAPVVNIRKGLYPILWE